MATELAIAHTTEPSFKSFCTWTNETKYADGSTYKGNLDRFGKRTGTGRFRTPIYIYGAYDISKASTLLNWMEYNGEWCNDKPCGWGIVKRHRGDGTTTTTYEGVWANGSPLNDP
jgi:hypothetical protein